MRVTDRARGATVAEVVVVVFLALTVGALLIGCWGKTYPHGRGAECASRMRQIGLAVFQYEKRFLAMPNAQENIYSRLSPYLGLAPPVLVPDPALTEVLRCPRDQYVPEDERWNALSYAPIVDSAYLDGDDNDSPDGNRLYCAWSHNRRSDEISPTGDVPWELINLTHTAPDTAIMVEQWDPDNRLDLGNLRRPGYLGHERGTGNTMGTLDFIGRPVKEPIARVPDVGGYTFLAAFAHTAQKRAQPVGVMDIVHDGAINLLYVDGSVCCHRLDEITNKSPKDVPMWTRTPD